MAKTKIVENFHEIIIIFHQYSLIKIHLIHDIDFVIFSTSKSHCLKRITVLFFISISDIYLKTLYLFIKCMLFLTRLQTKMHKQVWMLFEIECMNFETVIALEFIWNTLFARDDFEQVSIENRVKWRVATIRLVLYLHKS